MFAFDFFLAFLPGQTGTFLRHTGESREARLFLPPMEILFWIPAFAGMTTGR